MRARPSRRPRRGATILRLVKDHEKGTDALTTRFCASSAQLLWAGAFRCNMWCDTRSRKSLSSLRARDLTGCSTSRFLPVSIKSDRDNETSSPQDGQCLREKTLTTASRTRRSGTRNGAYGQNICSVGKTPSLHKQRKRLLALSPTGTWSVGGRIFPAAWTQRPPASRRDLHALVIHAERGKPGFLPLLLASYFRYSLVTAGKADRKGRPQEAG